MATAAQKLSLFLNALRDRPALEDLPEDIRPEASALFSAWDDMAEDLKAGSAQAAGAAAFPGDAPPVQLDAAVIAALPATTQAFAAAKPSSDQGADTTVESHAGAFDAQHMAPFGITLGKAVPDAAR
jgi:hypothetical protein